MLDRDIKLFIPEGSSMVPYFRDSPFEIYRDVYEKLRIPAFEGIFGQNLTMAMHTYTTSLAIKGEAIAISLDVNQLLNRDSYER